MRPIRQPELGETVIYTDYGAGFRPLGKYAAIVVGYAIDDFEEIVPLQVMFCDILRGRYVTSIEFRTAQYSINKLDKETWHFKYDQLIDFSSGVQ